MDIVITGCSRGIGLEMVRLFAADNNNRVLAVSRNVGPLKNIQEQFPESLMPFAAEITTTDFIPLFCRHLESLKFAPSVLINNAGLLINKRFEELTANDVDALVAVNLKSPFLIIRALIPYLSKPAHIVNIGSMGGFQGSEKFPGLSLYSATKGALAVLTECLAVELQGSGIAINCLALGSAQTEMLQEAFPGYVSPISAQAMAGFIHRFALDGHHFFNGKVIPVSSTTP